MAKVTFRSDNPPTSEAEIAKFEKANSVKLPDAYRSFLLQQNGGHPTPDKIAVPKWEGGYTGLNRFFAIKPERGLQHYHDRFEDRVPKGFLPIADDPGGNLFLLALKGKRAGQIYLWDHEDELDDEGDSKQDMSNMYKVAEDIDDFLQNKLMPDE
jgi:hypothetical protein